MRPESVIPKPGSLKKNIIKTFEKKRIEMRAVWNSIDSRISFTTDIWSAPNDNPFMAITGHWIDCNFKMRSMLMNFVALPGNGVFDKKMATTLDNASNNDVLCITML
jgi:hypothetical protein